MSQGYEESNQKVLQSMRSCLFVLEGTVRQSGLIFQYSFVEVDSSSKLLDYTLVS